MQSRITHAMKTGDGEWEQTMLGTLRILGGKLPRNVPWRRCAIPAVSGGCCSVWGNGHGERFFSSESAERNSVNSAHPTNQRKRFVCCDA